MDREKVIKGLHCCARTDGRSCIYCPYDSAEEYCTTQMSMDVLDLLKEQEHGWIPVSERLPEDGSDILVYCDDGEESRIVACNYDNGVWFDCVFNTVMVFKNITHWMPLPKPPKEGDGE